MVDVAQVKMFGKPVGSVSWSSRYGVARFEAFLSGGTRDVSTGRVQCGGQKSR